MALITFLLFTGFVAFYATWRLRRDRLDTQDGYFLGGRSLPHVLEEAPQQRDVQLPGVDESGGSGQKLDELP